MTNEIDPKLYDEILNNDSFLNDLFTQQGTTDKISMLKTAGFDLAAEFHRWNEEFNSKHNEQLL